METLKEVHRSKRSNSGCNFGVWNAECYSLYIFIVAISETTDLGPRLHLSRTIYTLQAPIMKFMTLLLATLV